MSTTTTSRPASGRAERAPGRTSGAGALARSLRTHPELWALAAIVAGGIALRLSTLRLQSFWADEAVPGGRVLRPGPWSPPPPGPPTGARAAGSQLPAR